MRFCAASAARRSTGSCRSCKSRVAGRCADMPTSRRAALFPAEEAGQAASGTGSAFKFVTQLKHFCYRTITLGVYYNNQDPLFNINTLGPTPRRRLVHFFFVSPNCNESYKCYCPVFKHVVGATNRSNAISPCTADFAAMFGK
jgi:hypothetical protein